MTHAYLMMGCTCLDLGGFTVSPFSPARTHLDKARYFNLNYYYSHGLVIGKSGYIGKSLSSWNTPRELGVSSYILHKYVKRNYLHRRIVSSHRRVALLPVNRACNSLNKYTVIYGTL